MGCGGSCLSFAGYILVALAAVLLNFHMECINEREVVRRDKAGYDFRQEQTDNKIQMDFAEQGVDYEMDLGPTFMLVQSAPCAVVKLMDFLGLGVKLISGNYSKHNVTIYDVRKNSLGSFHETGFTLIELPEDPLTTDWRTTTMMEEEPDIRKFHSQMEPYIRQLYPEVKRLDWNYNVVRGGNKFGDQPPAVGHPHLDFHQNDTARLQFHTEFPPLKGTEAELLIGGGDNHDGKLEVVLGVWKPLYPNAVCDFPLTVMDARTFDPDHQSKNKFHISLGFLTFENLMAVASYSPKQKWAYYSFQTPREVLIFHQYSKNRFFANPHTSFYNKNCPEGWETRMSVEMRLNLFF